MGKRTAHLFCHFGTFVFLLYCANVSSVQTSQSIIEVMKNDTNLQLCNVPTFLYENNITEVCSTLKYPKANVTVDNEYTKTFLCLAFYDTCYKACNSSQLQKSFNSTSSFSSYIQKLYLEGKETGRNIFCENVKNITFSYKKLIPLLSHVRLNSLCNVECFDVNEVFNPLCVILAWRKNFDDNGKNNVLVEKSNTKLKEKKLLKVLAPVSSKDIIPETTEKNNIATNKINEFPPNDDIKITESQQGSVPQSVVTSSVDINPNLKTNSAKAVNNANSFGSYQKEAQTNAKTVNVPKNSVKPSEVGDGSTDKGNIKNNDKESVKDVSEDTRTNTLSENTQDQEDLIPVELPYDPNESLTLPMDPGDQTQNMPEPSEQRDTSHYHNIRSDDESHFFTYFSIVSFISIALYIGYHNKQKILAIVLEGRRSRNNRGRRRPSTANYRKLDCTLEEAVTSQCNANVTHVIY